MKKTTTILTAVLALAAPATPAEAAAAMDDNCRLTAQIRAPQGMPVAGAAMTVLPAGLPTTSDSGGRACVTDLADGRHRLVVVAEGFAVAERAVELVAGSEQRVEIELRPAFGEELVVTSTRTLKRLADVSVHMQIVDRERIESTVSRTLADIVEWTAGMRVESTCQNCNQPTIRMLGLDGPYSQVLVDGQPTVSSLALVYGVEQLPSRLIDSVEVVKGGGSALYGAGAVAGVINLIPHQATHVHTTFDASFGDQGGEGMGSLSAIADWASSDRTRLLTGFAQLDRVDPVDLDGDGFSEVTRRELAAVGARFDRYLWEGDGRLTAEINHIAEDRRGGDRLDLPPDQAEIAEEILSERLGTTLSWLHAPSSRLDYRLVLSYSHTDRDTYYGTGMDPNAFGATTNALSVFDAQFNRYRENGTFTWGLQYNRDGIDDRQPGYDRQIEETYTDWGLFLQDDRELGDRWTLLYGVRVNRHSEVEDPIAAPRLALLWAPRSDLTLRSSLARGFRAPVVFDEDLHISLVGGGESQIIRNAPDLGEETSTSTTLSAEWRPAFGRKGSATLEVNLFRTGLVDLFDTQEDDDPATEAIELTRVNFGDAEVWGAELSAAMRWGSRFSGELAVVEQRARFGQPEPDFGNRDFHRTPERYGMATLQWSEPGWADFFLGLQYTGPMWVPHYAGFIVRDRLERTPSFLTVDLNVARSFELGSHRQLTVTVGTKNLTDEYQEDLDQGPGRDPSYVYGPRFPRSYFVGLKFEI